jgi:hypothetical protein
MLGRAIWVAALGAFNHQPGFAAFSYAGAGGEPMTVVSARITTASTRSDSPAAAIACSPVSISTTAWSCSPETPKRAKGSASATEVNRDG